MGLTILKKYYRQLQFLANRFPMQAGQECEAEFSWDELYSQREVVHTDVRFEQQSIMYNIGALHSYLGCLDKRSNDEVCNFLLEIFYRDSSLFLSLSFWIKFISSNQGHKNIVYTLSIRSISFSNCARLLFNLWVQFWLGRIRDVPQIEHHDGIFQNSPS